MPKKETHASRAVRVVSPTDDYDNYADGLPSKTFHVKVMCTEAITHDKLKASQAYKHNMKSGQLDDSNKDDLGTIHMDGVDNQDEWEDIDNGMEVNNELMLELLVFRCALSLLNSERLLEFLCPYQVAIYPIGRLHCVLTPLLSIRRSLSPFSRHRPLRILIICAVPGLNPGPHPSFSLLLISERFPGAVACSTVQLAPYVTHTVHRAPCRALESSDFTELDIDSTTHTSPSSAASGITVETRCGTLLYPGPLIPPQSTLQSLPAPSPGPTIEIKALNIFNLMETMTISLTFMQKISNALVAHGYPAECWQSSAAMLLIGGRATYVPPAAIGSTRGDGPPMRSETISPSSGTGTATPSRADSPASKGIYPALPASLAPKMEERDPTDDAPHVDFSCIKNWKAAQMDEKKRSWDVFEEMGIFVKWRAILIHPCSCCQGAPCAWRPSPDWIQQWVLFRWDNQAKLPGTSVQTTACTHGPGLEDLGTREQLFRHSNQLAPVIHYTTVYRWCVLVDVLFEQWDWEKYLNLRKMLYENYLQALTTISEQMPVLEGAMQSLNVTKADLERFTTEEHMYLASLGKRPQKIFARFSTLRNCRHCVT
ncbi:hypothetical protein NUW54_g3361 [Trametes sanguinea]|uniref:Uncharacterized protein n=1 Tax=Trametes sanguinea TaxID=158606 RepID=A0ACC1Q2L9_9APHY|nr:hypothetical protein NUW54_g3361 [Trametes sanguinea]